MKKKLIVEAEQYDLLISQIDQLQSELESSRRNMSNANKVEARSEGGNDWQESAELELALTQVELLQQELEDVVIERDNLVSSKVSSPRACNTNLSIRLIAQIRAR
ncbi:hypothetical protein KUV95_11795 [Microbulbifer agarilyticus]|uniref:hypothetical protein n=1 Tax=Microbulbifer agarilyticus TaxID=260552 RepID=UPI001C9496A9|nr:hypothetical protein [Microbulbifer agarilyticus]MBY6212234.1 hypothetical protein [Microbulbifer agarilyticus]